MSASTGKAHPEPSWPHPAGTEAVVTDDVGRRWRTVTRSDAWLLPTSPRPGRAGWRPGTKQTCVELVLIEGIAGGYLASRLELPSPADAELRHFRDRREQL